MRSKEWATVQKVQNEDWSSIATSTDARTLLVTLTPFQPRPISPCTPTRANFAATQQSEDSTNSFELFRITASDVRLDQPPYGASTNEYQHSQKDTFESMMNETERKNAWRSTENCNNSKRETTWLEQVEREKDCNKHKKKKTHTLWTIPKELVRRRHPQWQSMFSQRRAFANGGKGKNAPAHRSAELDPWWVALRFLGRKLWLNLA